jgi:hypothetical protein
MMSVQHPPQVDRSVRLRHFFRRKFNFDFDSVFSDVHRVDAIEPEVVKSEITQESEKDLV